MLWKLLGLSIVGAGGVVGYAWYDADFKQTLEDRIPYAKQGLEFIFDSLLAPKDTQPVS